MLFGLPQPTNPRLQLLKNVVLFKDLNMRELAMVNSLMHERRSSADEVIFDEGEEGQGLFLVLSGRVKITLPAHVEQVLIELGPGAFFGEVALLDSSIRTAQARAIEDSQIVALFRTEFYSLLDTHSAIASRISFQLAKVLAARLRQTVVNAARIQHHAAADAGVDQRREHVVGDDGDHHRHNEPEHVLEKDKQQAGRGDNPEPDDGSGGQLAMRHRPRFRPPHDAGCAPH